MSEKLGLPVNDKQARLLKMGITLFGVDRIPRVRDVNGILSAFLEKPDRVEEDVVEVPIELVDSVQQLAQLVIDHEMDHERNLSRSRLMPQLDLRTDSSYGLYAKLRVLDSITRFDASSLTT